MSAELQGLRSFNIKCMSENIFSKLTVCLRIELILQSGCHQPQSWRSQTGIFALIDRPHDELSSSPLCSALIHSFIHLLKDQVTECVPWPVVEASLMCIKIRVVGAHAVLDIAKIEIYSLESVHDIGR